LNDVKADLKVSLRRALWAVVKADIRLQIVGEEQLGKRERIVGAAR